MRAALSFIGRAAALFFFCVPSYAVTITDLMGYYKDGVDGNANYSLAAAACQSAYDANPSPACGTPTCKNPGCVTNTLVNGDNNLYCGGGQSKQVNWSYNDGVNIYLKAYRYCATGVFSCPPGTSYNSITHLCETIPVCTVYPQGTVKNWKFTDPTLAALPATLCMSNCRFKSDSLVLFFPIIHYLSGQWTSTGDYCAGDGSADYAPSAPVESPTPDVNCVVGSSGVQLCGSTSTNCGTVNGQVYCPDAVPPGNCTLLPGGSYICDSGSPTSTADDAPRPTGAAPNTVPETVVSGTANGSPTPTSTENHIYGPSTSGNSAPAQESTLKDVKNGQCGGPGQPPCKIDETGTPTAGTNEGDGAANAFDSLTSGIGTSVSVAGSSSGWFNGLLPLSTSTCTTLVFGAQGHTRTFPSTAECAMLNDFKSVLHWAFYVLTIIAIFFIGAKKTG